MATAVRSWHSTPRPAGPGRQSYADVWTITRDGVVTLGVGIWAQAGQMPAHRESLVWQELSMEDVRALAAWLLAAVGEEVHP
jgi:hypothetical protein